MQKPKMIVFDYGQTLIAEQKFDGVKGTREVLKYATQNKYNLSAKEVQAEAEKINAELGRFDPLTRHLCQVEVPNRMFCSYLYESLGIQLSLSQKELDKVFWDAASPGKPTDGIEDFLELLHRNEIRTGVISNISYDGKVVENRINELLPNNHFEFVIATSDYMFRKPSKRIFDLALEKAELHAEDVWYIGDQYECDIVGAEKAGIFPVWYIGAIDLPYAEKEDVLTVQSWEEVEQALGGLSKG